MCECVVDGVEVTVVGATGSYSYLGDETSVLPDPTLC